MSFASRINNIKADIQALITYANETTGESDTTISDAVDSLVSGYGGGELEPYYTQSFTLDSDITDTSSIHFIATYKSTTEEDWIGLYVIKINDDITDSGTIKLSCGGIGNGGAAPSRSVNIMGDNSQIVGLNDGLVLFNGNVAAKCTSTIKKIKAGTYTIDFYKVLEL